MRSLARCSIARRHSGDHHDGWETGPIGPIAFRWEDSLSEASRAARPNVVPPLPVRAPVARPRLVPRGERESGGEGEAGAAVVAEEWSRRAIGTGCATGERAFGPRNRLRPM